MFGFAVVFHEDEDYAKKAENFKERVYKHISSKKLQTSITDFFN